MICLRKMANKSTSSQTANAMTRAYCDFLSAEMQRGSRMSPSAACRVKPLGTRGFPLGVRGEHFDFEAEIPQIWPNMAKWIVASSAYMGNGYEIRFQHHHRIPVQVTNWFINRRCRRSTPTPGLGALNRTWPVFGMKKSHVARDLMCLKQS